MTVNEKIFKPSRRPKLFILIILSPLIILLSAVVVADFTVENIIFYVFMIMFFFVLAGIDIFGKHILVKEKVIIQRDYFFRVEQLDIASIRECSIFLKKTVNFIYSFFSVLLPVLVAQTLSMWIVFGIFVQIVKKYPEPFLTSIHFLTQFIGEEASRYIVSFAAIVPVLYVMKNTTGFILNIIYNVTKIFKK